MFLFLLEFNNYVDIESAKSTTMSMQIQFFANIFGEFFICKTILAF